MSGAVGPFGSISVQRWLFNALERTQNVTTDASRRLRFLRTERRVKILDDL